MAADAGVHTLPAAQFGARQRLHFAGAVLLPTALSLAGPFVLPLGGHPGWALGLLLGLWFVVGGVGVSVGLHRHFSHRSFDGPPALRWLLGACGQMAAQGPVVYWVALHRLHHAASDRPGDPHSPQPQAWPGRAAGRSAWRAFWRGHLGWVPRHDVPKPTRYARDLIGDPVVRSLGRHYHACVAAGVLLPAALSLLALGPVAPLGTGALGAVDAALFGAWWGGVLRIALGHHVIWAINSCCHVRRARADDTGEHSRNLAWLALPSWGESWHHNHHAHPAQARFGRGWRQPDIGWQVVRLLAWLGLARVRSGSG